MKITGLIKGKGIPVEVRGDISSGIEAAIGTGSHDIQLDVFWKNHEWWVKITILSPRNTYHVIRKPLSNYS